jgi:hypothetical protein
MGVGGGSEWDVYITVGLDRHGTRLRGILFRHALHGPFAFRRATGRTKLSAAVPNHKYPLIVRWRFACPSATVGKHNVAEHANATHIR